MRLWKTAIGALMIGFAIFVIVGEQLAGVSADAVVNARLATIRAPIAGRLTLPNATLGSYVQKGELLGSISDPLADNSSLADLRNQTARLAADINRLSATKAAIGTALEALSERSLIYRRERLRQLEAQVLASRSLIDVARAEVHLAQQTLDRAAQLSRQGIETVQGLEQAQSRLKVAQLQLESARARATVEEAGLAAGRRGTFLGDGYNDAPYSEQRIEELQLRQKEVAAELDAALAGTAALNARVSAELLRVNRLSSASLSAIANGLLWSFDTANGQVVQRGQTLLTLVDCDTILVTASVSENVYNRLSIGSPTEFRLTDNSDVMAGSVVRLAGTGARTVYENLAIAPTEEHLERFDVAVMVPTLLTDERYRCQIGRTGRIFFERRPLDWLRQFWR